MFSKTSLEKEDLPLSIIDANTENEGFTTTPSRKSSMKITENLVKISVKRLMP
jgi:hypothetical protein